MKSLVPWPKFLMKLPSSNSLPDCPSFLCLILWKENVSREPKLSCGVFLFMWVFGLLRETRKGRESQLRGVFFFLLLLSLEGAAERCIWSQSGVFVLVRKKQRRESRDGMSIFSFSVCFCLEEMLSVERKKNEWPRRSQLGLVLVKWWLFTKWKERCMEIECKMG